LVYGVAFCKKKMKRKEKKRVEILFMHRNHFHCMFFRGEHNSRKSNYIVCIFLGPGYI
jgi:hypothetical protein